MAKKQKQSSQPRVLLNWVSAQRQYRAVMLPETNIVIQTMVGETWTLLSAPMPASWEHSLVVVAMRLVEERAKITTPPREIRQ